MNSERNLPSRRGFLKTVTLGTAGAPLVSRAAQGFPRTPGPAASPFKLKYAPAIGMFEQHAGKNPVDQIKFMADEGFQAMFDNGLMNRPTAEQEAIARETARLNMAIGPFVAYADFGVKSFVTRDPAVREMLAGKLKTAIETAGRTHARWSLVVPGRFDESLDWDYQTANVVENLKWADR